MTVFVVSVVFFTGVTCNRIRMSTKVGSCNFWVVTQRRFSLACWTLKMGRIYYLLRKN
jgi:hypothetical protein